MNQLIKKAIFVGSISLTGLNVAIEEGYTPYLLRHNLHRQHSDQYQQVLIPQLESVLDVDFTDMTAVTDAAESFGIQSDTVFLFFKDNYLEPVVRLANHFQTIQAQALSIETMLKIKDKFQQKLALRKSPSELTSPGELAQTLVEAESFALTVGYPIIIKPINLSSSLYVKLAKNVDELRLAHNEVAQKVGKKEVILEKYISGDQYSIDSYVDYSGSIKHTPICRQHIGYDHGYNDFRTLYSEYPAEISLARKNSIQKVVEESISTLGIKGMVCHIEVKVDSSNNVFIIEINPRLGGYRHDMLKHSYGINHYRNMILTQLNINPIINGSFLAYSAAAQIWASIETIYPILPKFEQIQKLASTKKMTNLVKLGTTYGPPDRGYGRIAVLILANSNKQAMYNDLNTIIDYNKLWQFQ